MKIYKIHHQIILILLCLFSQSAYAKSPLVWTRSYENAVEKSKASHKPIALFFTGSDWSAWYAKLNREVLENDDFAALTSNKMIFLQLDFPIRTSLPEREQSQNTLLKEKYSVRSFPTVLLLDERQRLIGVTGYRPGGGKQYAEHLLKMIEEYSNFRQKMDSLQSAQLTGKELKRLYQKAQELAMHEDAAQILRLGIHSEQKQYFLTEKYRRLASEGMIHDDQAVALKQQLLAGDPDNSQLTHYKLAVIDFEVFSAEMEQKGYDAELAVSPLENYISGFGKKDVENLWRLQMIVSQVYLDKSNIQKALEYAEAAYLSAPLTIQPDIAEAVINIQKIDKKQF